MGSTGPKNQAFACQPPLQARLSSQWSKNCTQEANTWVLNSSTQHKRPLPLTPTQTPNSWVSGGMSFFWSDSSLTFECFQAHPQEQRPHFRSWEPLRDEGGKRSLPMFGIFL